MSRKKKTVPEEQILEPADNETVEAESSDIELEVMPPEAVIEEQAEKATQAIEDVKSKQEQDKEKFIYAQLKAINKMNNPALAKRQAERILRNRKG